VRKRCEEVCVLDNWFVRTAAPNVSSSWTRRDSCIKSRFGQHQRGWPMGNFNFIVCIYLAMAGTFVQLRSLQFLAALKSFSVVASSTQLSDADANLRPPDLGKSIVSATHPTLWRWSKCKDVLFVRKACAHSVHDRCDCGPYHELGQHQLSKCPSANHEMSHLWQSERSEMAWFPTIGFCGDA